MVSGRSYSRDALDLPIVGERQQVNAARFWKDQGMDQLMPDIGARTAFIPAGTIGPRSSYLVGALLR